MKNVLNLKYVFAKCEELTAEERQAKLIELGFSEDDIAKLSLELPKDFKAGDRLFLQNDLTKARNDERRKVEGNLRHKDPQTPPPVVQTPANTDPANPVQVNQGLTQEAVQKLIQESVSQALTQAQTANQEVVSQLQQQLEAVNNDIKTKEQKALDKLKASLLAQLPEDVHSLLNGTNEEELTTSFNLIKGFVDKTTEEAKNAVATEEKAKEVAKTIFYKAEDGTEYKTVTELTANPAHLQEFKQKFN
jgi:hypothetical protein